MKHILFILIALTAVIGAEPAKAVLKIDITQGQANPLPIAITPLVGGGAQGEEIANVITSDLESSGLFKAIDKTAFIQRFSSPGEQPRFADWRQINAQAVVTGDIKPQEGKISVTFQLWDILSGQQFISKSYVSDAKNSRRVAHLIADEIYSRLTGEGAYFDSRIVYVDEVQNGRQRTRRLAVMDQDGANPRILTDGRDMVLTPRFSPTSQQIIYMAYHGNLPRVYLYNMETGSEQVIGDFKGMSFAPRFSPDGRKAVMSVSLEGNTEIFVLDLASRQTTRLTNDPSIDTSPSYAPEGDRIVFNSNRGGSQQLYVMNSDGSNVKRISFGKGTYGTPVWSPRGDYIAFTRIYQGQFHIGVMRPDGSGERLLTESFLDEGPTWSPNGRVLAFFRQGRGSSGRQGNTSLHTVDLTGRNERQIRTSNEATDPAWSPLLSARK